MEPLKHFVSERYFVQITIKYFVLVNIHKLEYHHFCVVAILISFVLYFFCILSGEYIGIS